MPMPQVRVCTSFALVSTAQMLEGCIPGAALALAASGLPRRRQPPRPTHTPGSPRALRCLNLSCQAVVTTKSCGGTEHDRHSWGSAVKEQGGGITKNKGVYTGKKAQCAGEGRVAWQWVGAMWRAAACLPLAQTRGTKEWPGKGSTAASSCIQLHASSSHASSRPPAQRHLGTIITGTPPPGCGSGRGSPRAAR